MNKQILFLCFLCISTKIFSQQTNEKIAMVVDSILVQKDPEPGNELKVDELAYVLVLKNKDSLHLLGFEGFDGVTFFFTKAYQSRPDSIRLIPSSKQMVEKNGSWYFRDAIYSGRFIDYYYSGKKQGDGIFVSGKLNGPRYLYYQNGQLMAKKIYKNGLENGISQEFYSDGSLRQNGNYIDGKEEGIWTDYYPNAQIELRGNYINGEPTDSVYRYYSSGKIKERIFIQNGKVKADPAMAKIASLLQKSKESSEVGDNAGAIKYCNKIIALDSSFAGAYFSKATLELNDEKFDAAIADFDLALRFEPFTMAAYTNRAFARIRKQESAGSRTILKNKNITVQATKDSVDIPAPEKEKICADFKEAIYLGEKKAMVYEAMEKNCE